VNLKDKDNITALMESAMVRHRYVSMLGVLS
jgi:hypothetical protein